MPSGDHLGAKSLPNRKMGDLSRLYIKHADISLVAYLFSVVTKGDRCTIGGPSGIRLGLIEGLIGWGDPPSAEMT